jgi:uncharacterized protein
MPTVIIQKLSEEEILRRGMRKWPVWEKEVSVFDHVYDSDEECLIIEGEVIIRTDHGDFTVKAGDFVTFRDGLKCTWDIRKNIRKYYNFK